MCREVTETAVVVFGFVLRAGLLFLVTALGAGTARRRGLACPVAFRWMMPIPEQLSIVRPAPGPYPIAERISGIPLVGSADLKIGPCDSRT